MNNGHAIGRSVTSEVPDVYLGFITDQPGSWPFIMNLSRIIAEISHMRENMREEKLESQHSSRSILPCAVVYDTRTAERKVSDLIYRCTQ